MNHIISPAYMVSGNTAGYCLYDGRWSLCLKNWVDVLTGGIVQVTPTMFNVANGFQYDSGYYS